MREAGQWTVLNSLNSMLSWMPLGALQKSSVNLATRNAVFNEPSALSLRVRYLEDWRTPSAGTGSQATQEGHLNVPLLGILTCPLDNNVLRNQKLVNVGSKNCEQHPPEILN